MRPLIAVNIWTYDKDEYKTFLCVTSLQKFLGSCIEIFVWNDSNFPINTQVRKRLEQLGCRVKDTHYARNLHQRGTKTLQGMAANFIESFEVSGASFLAKIDPDCLIINSNLSDFLKGNSVFAFSQNQKPYGNIYFMDSQVINFLRELIDGDFEKILRQRLRELKIPIDENLMVFEDLTFYWACIVVFGADFVDKRQVHEYWFPATDNNLNCLADKRKNNLVINFSRQKFWHDGGVSLMKKTLRLL